MARTVHKGQRDQRDQRVQKDQKDRQDLKGQLVHRAQQVLKGRLD